MIYDVFFPLHSGLGHIISLEFIKTKALAHHLHSADNRPVLEREKYE